MATTAQRGLQVALSALVMAACSSHVERPTASAPTPVLPIQRPRDAAVSPDAPTVPDAALDARSLDATTLDAGKPDDFVDIATAIPDAVIAMRYAIADNFVGRAVYPVNRCLLRRAVAKQLIAAATSLRSAQRRLLLWDCYRPASIQKEFWKLMPDPRYVAKPTYAADGTPRSGSRHSRGAAVDIGLADAAGAPVPMPSAHDDFSSRAHRSNAARSAAASDYRLLDAAMTRAGFVGIATEWWHYDGAGADHFSMADTPLQ